MGGVSRVLLRLDIVLGELYKWLIGEKGKCNFDKFNW